MKNVKKSMPIAIIVAIAAIAVYYIVFSILVTHAFGQPFLDNWSSLAASGASPVPGVGGFIPFFVFLVYNNPALYLIMFLALWLPIFFEFPPLIIVQTRYLFAWAFDRILPEKIASGKRKIPHPHRSYSHRHDWRTNSRGVDGFSTKLWRIRHVSFHNVFVRFHHTRNRGNSLPVQKESDIREQFRSEKEIHPSTNQLAGARFRSFT